MDKRPQVTVIMPVRNEADCIEKSLGAILDQDYPAENMEILVVDGMSDDGMRAIVQNMQEEHGNLLLLDNPRQTVPYALNIALARAHGEVIVRVDGHCIIAADYVTQCVKLLRQTGADNVGGLMRPVAENRIGQAVTLATSSLFGVGDARFHFAKNAGWVDTVYLGTYRRDVFERIGTFDEELTRNQDDEFNFRLQQAGGRIWLDPSIQSVYFPRSSWKKLWRQYFEYGLYKVRVIQKRNAVPSWRHLVPGLFTLTLIVSAMLALLGFGKRWLLAVLGPYSAVNLAASVHASRKEPALTPLVSLAFVILHVAYGMGFLVGLVRFAGRWGNKAGGVLPA